MKPKRQSLKLAGTSALALAMSTILIPSADAEPSRQQVVTAALALSQAGCTVTLLPTTSNPKVGLTCSNNVVSGLLNPYLAQSGFRIYSTGWRGKTKLDWRIGPQEISSINFRQPASRTTVLGNGKLGQWGGTFSPYDARVRIGRDITSRAESITPIRGGFKLTIPFSTATLLCEGDPVGPGGWQDDACPDLTWRNPKIYGNLILNRDLTLSQNSSISTSGSWALGGIGIFVSDRWANNLVTRLANAGLQAIIPGTNNYIQRFAKASIVAKYPRMPESCLDLSYTNDNLNIYIPVDASRHANCASALGIQPIAASSSNTGNGDSRAEDQSCANQNTYMGIWSFKDKARNKYARGSVTAEGRNDVVGAVATSVSNPNRAWETFKLYSIPGVEGGRRLQNTIDGRWLETVNATNTLLLHGPVRACSTTNKDMQWRVVNVQGQRGVYKLQNLRTNKFVKVTGNGLLKANASESQATRFGWNRY